MLICLQNVGILINGSVADLVGSRVECEYGPGVSTAVTVHLGYGPAQIQTCPLLPREDYRPIPPGTGEAAGSNFPPPPPPRRGATVTPSAPFCLSADHLSVSVAIKVNGTSVVSGSFVIYDCERTGAIHPKTP